MKKTLKDIVKFLLFFSVGIFFIWLSVRNLTSDDKNNIIESFRTANYFWVIPCIFVGILSHILRARRWIILMEPLGYKPPLIQTFYALMVGYFVNMALPRLGEVSRCGILNKYEKIPFNKSFGTVVTERALDMLIFIILFVIVSITQYRRFGSYLEANFFEPMRSKIPVFDTAIHLLIWITLALIIVGLILTWIYRRKLLKLPLIAKIWSVLRGFLSGMHSLLRIKHPVEFIVLTVCIWVLYYFMVYLCFFSIPETSVLGLAAGFSVLLFGSVGVIVTPGGIGLYPAIVAETLKSYSIVYSYGLALGWISWAAQAFMIITTGSISLILLSFNKKENGPSTPN